MSLNSIAVIGNFSFKATQILRNMIFKFKKLLLKNKLKSIIVDTNWQYNERLRVKRLVYDKFTPEAG